MIVPSIAGMTFNRSLNERDAIFKVPLLAATIENTSRFTRSLTACSVGLLSASADPSLDVTVVALSVESDGTAAATEVLAPDALSPYEQSMYDAAMNGTLVGT